MSSRFLSTRCCHAAAGLALLLAVLYAPFWRSNPARAHRGATHTVRLNPRVRQSRYSQLSVRLVHTALQRLKAMRSPEAETVDGGASSSDRPVDPPALASFLNRHATSSCGIVVTQPLRC